MKTLVYCALVVAFMLSAPAAVAQETMSHEGMDHGTDHSMDHGMDHSMDHSMHHGPAADQAAARKVIDDLFDAMRAADAGAFSALFHERARLMSTGTRGGAPFLMESDLAEFTKSVAAAEKGSLDERIWDVMIHVNGTLAMVWTPYAFYHNGNFSHCGVNAFHLVATTDGWKILQVTDTRQTEGCEVPD